MVGLLLFPHEILHLPSIFCSSSAASKPSPRSRRRSSRRSAAQPARRTSPRRRVPGAGRWRRWPWGVRVRNKWTKKTKNVAKSKGKLVKIEIPGRCMEMLGYLRTSEDIPRTCYDLRLRKGQKIVVLPMTSRILLREFIYEMGKRLEFSLFDSGNGMFTSSITEGDWYKQCKGRFWNSSWWTIGTFHSTSGDGIWRTKECGWQSGLSPCSSGMGNHQRFESSLLHRCKPRNWTKNACLWNPMNMNS